MPMHEIVRLLSAIAVAAALLHLSGSLAPAEAQAPTRQIKLTEKQVQSFIAAQKQMAKAKSEAEFEAIAREHGFTSLDEIDDVEANIVLLMNAFDPGTRTFGEPPALIKRRIDEVTADTAMPEAARKQALQELTVALKNARPIQFPGNIELVKKYYERLQTALE